MSEIVVVSKTQKIIVNPASSSVSVINAGPMGPRGLIGPSEADTILTANGDILTRVAGVLARTTRASLAADTAFSSLYSSLAPRVTAIAYAASITPNSATTDVVNVGTLTGAITINAPTGTPVDGQLLQFRFIQDGTGRVITWDAAFVWGTDVIAALVPSTANAKFEVLFMWNATSSKWRAMSIVRGFA